MQNHEIEDTENEEIDAKVEEVLAAHCTYQSVVQRKRNVRYVVAEETAEGLQVLVGLVGAAAIVKRFQEFYIARNPLLSLLDRIDTGKYEGELVFPEQGDEEVIEFNLLKNLPKPGARRTKWGELKPYVAQAVDLLEKNGEKDANVERVKQVAERLKKAAEQAKDTLLG